jgi:hypothetical protein
MLVLLSGEWRHGMSCFQEWCFDFRGAPRLGAYMLGASSPAKSARVCVATKRLKTIPNFRFRVPAAAKMVRAVLALCPTCIPWQIQLRRYSKIFSEGTNHEIIPIFKRPNSQFRLNTQNQLISEHQSARASGR